MARPESLYRQMQAVKLFRRRHNLLRKVKYTKKYAPWSVRWWRRRARLRRPETSTIRPSRRLLLSCVYVVARSFA
ncbi:ribosomal protein L7 [Culex quinquefasciatus]|uniref:Ribosomal protein L7 n=1 Tax=Culex quinquefasciatus TaxID=7176 RepID=B0XGS7_CULQU|nr:ribosomal protein L7 [Culex quinquefasciatus]|eukprot:XP_001868849.1 ribosomal protein L7 [Culex quinquefasciatus]